MLWVVLIVLLIGCFVTSGVGKIVCGAGVLAVGFMLVSAITGWGFLEILAKGCLVVIVVAIVGGLLAAIFG